MALLEVRGVSMRFGGHAALDSVDLAAEAGSITGLIGPNGAGKTTLFNCITGLLSATSGKIFLDGRDVTRLSPYKRARSGVGRTFQRLELFTSLTVEDNLRVAGDIRNRWHRDRIDVALEVRRQLEVLGLTQYAHRKVADISTGMARRVELGRTLMTHPRILLLDEPASGQDEHETEEFGEILLRLAADGVGVLLVEHDVSLVFGVCSFVHVLDFGRILAHGTGAEIQSDPQVLAAYLGTGAGPS